MTHSAFNFVVIFTFRIDVSNFLCFPYILSMLQHIISNFRYTQLIKVHISEKYKSILRKLQINVSVNAFVCFFELYSFTQNALSVKKKFFYNYFLLLNDNFTKTSSRKALCFLSNIFLLHYYKINGVTRSMFLGKHHPITLLHNQQCYPLTFTSISRQDVVKYFINISAIHFRQHIFNNIFPTIFHHYLQVSLYYVPLLKMLYQ